MGEERRSGKSRCGGDEIEDLFIQMQSEDLRHIRSKDLNLRRCWTKG